MSLNKDSKSILVIYIEVALCLFLSLAYGFLSPFYLPAAKPIETNVPRISDKLVLVLMDGMRKDFAFNPKLMPNIYRLSQEGASGVSKTSNFPLTIAAMRALGSGVPYSARDILYNYQRVKTVVKTDKGKIRLNNKHSLDENIDSIFQATQKQGRKVVLSGDDIWINCYGSAISEAILSKADEDTPHGTTDDSDVHKGALRFLQENDFDILIIHYQSLDRTGHNNTPLSGKYRKKALEVDQYIAEIEEKLPPNTTLFIFSDHGMSDNGWHGKIDSPPPIVTEPPFVFVKNKIASVQNLYVDQIDLAPTLAFLLGLPIPAQSEGIVIDKIFSLTDKEKADILLANLNARNNYLNQLENSTGTKLNLPLNQAQTKYQEGNFFEAAKLAQENLKQINLLVELETKFNLKPLVKAFLLFSLLTFLLLTINFATPNIPWLNLALILSGSLISGFLTSVFMFGITDPLEIVGKFLTIVTVVLALLSFYLIYQIILNKEIYNLGSKTHYLFTLSTLSFGVIFIILTNTLSSLYLIISLCIIIFFAYNYKQKLLFRVLLTYGMFLFLSLGWLLNQSFFLDNKLFKASSLLLIGIFLVICFKAFNNFYRILSIIFAVVCGGLSLLQVLSKIDAIYSLLFFGICLFMIYLASNGERFIWPLLLLFSLIQFPVYANLALIKSISLSNLFTCLSLCIVLILCYYIYRQFIFNNQLSLLTQNEFICSLLPHLSFILATIGRLLHHPIRNELGKVSFLLLIINLASYLIFSAKRECKLYLLYVSILALSIATFEPLQLLLLSSVIFFQIWFTKNFSSNLSNHSVSLIMIYLVISFITYYNAYGNISLSSFFEEGRYPILGAQITDYSYWNLTIIISFIISKLVIVESIGLLILTESSKEINSLSRSVVGILSLVITFLLAIIWCYYQPGNQQILANISSCLLFIGIKMIIFSLALLLINLTKNNIKSKFSGQEIPAEGISPLA